MNIFLPTADPVQNARILDDRRMIKACLEYTQMLCTTVHVLSPEEHFKAGLYKPTHINHPCTRWARYSKRNYEYLIQSTWTMIYEYRFRFNRVHGCEKVLDVVQNCMSNVTLQNISEEHSPFYNCTPFPRLPVHEAYSSLLLTKWLNDTISLRPPKWTKRGAPELYLNGYKNAQSNQ